MTVLESYHFVIKSLIPDLSAKMGLEVSHIKIILSNNNIISKLLYIYIFKKIKAIINKINFICIVRICYLLINNIITKFD